MSKLDTTILEKLPANIGAVLSAFVNTAKNTLGSDLVSIVLYGSGAEGKLSVTSDVNLLLVLSSFDCQKTASLQENFLAAEAAIKLRAMFLLQKEIADAVNFFAQKFSDILRRHIVICGSDPFSEIKISREAEIFRLRQILLNLTLRLREAYVGRSRRAPQVARILADAFGPLRATSATLLALEGHPSSNSGSALEAVAASLGHQSVISSLAAVRDGRTLQGDAQSVLFQLIDLTARISERAACLSQERK
jgi:predicted nucleotidyltransferase